MSLPDISIHVMVPQARLLICVFRVDFLSTEWWLSLRDVPNKTQAIAGRSKTRFWHSSGSRSNGVKQSS